MKREHDMPECKTHWEMGGYSSRFPGPCEQDVCPCYCHRNGVETLLRLLIKLKVGAAGNRVGGWWDKLPRHGETRDVY
jgi:hypothetical protein